MQNVQKILVIIGITFLFYSCNFTERQNVGKQEKIKELIIYCENAIAPSIYELKNLFEKEYHCKVTIQNDCALNLIGLINYSFKGDLFIPSSLHSFEMLRRRSNAEIKDSVFLGYNKLVYMVKKGNPSGFDGKIKSLLTNDYSLIIANPESSSLGYETKKALTNRKVYEKILNIIVSLSTDSKGLIRSIKNNQADIVINLESTVFINGSMQYVDIIPFDPKNPYTMKVYAGVLSTTENEELAKDFLTFVNTQEGKSILNKYGISKRKTLIF
ncbi:MAG: molybdate ABC transporter substrate-binding protein [Chlorobi bacterium]|nr:molybdate ABC transporter substrate-binding protein [Chlorobiota bacterium]